MNWYWKFKKRNILHGVDNFMFSIFLGTMIGGLLPIQTAINSRLRQYVISPFISSLISFTVGTMFLLILNIVTGGHILLSMNQMNTIPWWAYLGGLLGTIGLTTNILLFPILGSVQTVIIPIMGQIIMSMLIDHFGWLGTPRELLTIFSLIGIGILIVGVITVIVLPDYLNQTRYVAEPIKYKLLWQLLGLFAGCAIATQVAINGHLGVIIHSSI